MAAGSAPEDPVTFRLGINSGRQMSKFLLKMSALLFNESYTLGVACGVFAPGFCRSLATRHTRAPKRPFYAPARLATFMKMRAREGRPPQAPKRRGGKGPRSPLPPPARMQPAGLVPLLWLAPTPRCCFSLSFAAFAASEIFCRSSANGLIFYLCDK
jgi:hypothetical protein